MSALVLIAGPLVGSATKANNIEIRHNQLGYRPLEAKDMVLMSDNEIEGLQYRILRITRRSGSELVAEGQLRDHNRIQGVTDYTPLAENFRLDLSHIQRPGRYLALFESPELGVHWARFRVLRPASELKNKDPHVHAAAAILAHLRVARSGSANARLHKISHQADAEAVVLRASGSAAQPDAWTKVDGLELDVAGGWYDAGDYIKFTLTNALTTYYLLRAYEINPELHEAAKRAKGPSADLLAEARHGLDYLAKLYVDGDFIMQVGSALDHEQPDRLPEHDTLMGDDRPARSAKVAHYMALVSAALATGARVFESVDAGYAKRCLDEAEEIWARAHDTDVLDYLPYERSWFYPDHSAADNMALAATELYATTGENTYLGQAEAYAEAAGYGWYSSWETLNLTANARLGNFSATARERATVELGSFSAFSKGEDEWSELDEGNIWYKPMGPVWAGLYNYMQVGGEAALRSLNGDDRYMEMANGIWHYLLGRNQWGVSFLALPELHRPATQTYNQVYRISGAFPLGAVAEGPVDSASHEANLQWMKSREEIEALVAESPFNTNFETFVDHNRDYVNMETTIFGQAATLYMLSSLHARQSAH